VEEQKTVCRKARHFINSNQTDHSLTNLRPAGETGKRATKIFSWHRK